jgi:hypothetical protein
MSTNRHPPSGHALLLSVLACLACGGPATIGGDGGGSGGTPQLVWWTTCGDPVCQLGGHRDAGLSACTTETAGAACTAAGAHCDLDDSCNVHLECSATDPKQVGCPVSRKSAKTDIHYLSAAELEKFRDELLSLPLATFRYRTADPGARLHLGFMIDDRESAICVDPQRGQIDLYGYASMAVAALQVQAREIAELRRELAELRAHEAGRRGARKEARAAR